MQAEKQQAQQQQQQMQKQPAAEKKNGMPALCLAELVAGLEHAISRKLAESLAEALGVEDEDEDLSGRLQQLTNRGAGIRDLIDKFCVPKFRSACVEGMEAMLKNEIRTVRDANSKYAEDPKTYSASFGLEEHFYQGLDEFNGRPDGDNIEAQMRKEFQKTEPFTTRNYGGIVTSLQQEWEFVEAPRTGKTYPGEKGLPRGDGSFHPGRERHPLKMYMDKNITKRAGLLRAEVIALRLYTGPPYMQLNLGLRSGGRKAAEKKIANFPATCSALNSAIKKLARVTPLPLSRRLYRGLSGMALPEDVLTARRFVEFAFSSATPVKEVAQLYAGSDRSSIFEIEVGEIDRGADISEFSQYPQEQEHVIPPLSHFEIVRVRREGNVNCYQLKLNVNLRALTLAELRSARKNVVWRLARRLQFEAEQLLDAPSPQVEQVVQTKIEPVGDDWFNDPANFKAAICELVDKFTSELRLCADAKRQRAHAPDTPEQDRLELLHEAAHLLTKASSTPAEKAKVSKVQGEMLAMLPQGQGKGSEHLDLIATNALVLAKNLQAEGNLEESLQMLDRCLSMQQDMHSQEPSGHPDIAEVLYWKAKALQETNSKANLDASLQVLQDALEMRRALGDSNREIALLHNSMGLVYRDMDDLPKALAACQQALAYQSAMVYKAASSGLDGAATRWVGGDAWVRGWVVRVGVVGSMAGLR